MNKNLLKIQKELDLLELQSNEHEAIQLFRDRVAYLDTCIRNESMDLKFINYNINKLCEHVDRMNASLILQGCEVIDSFVEIDEISEKLTRGIYPQRGELYV